jgi:ribonuclease P protein component
MTWRSLNKKSEFQKVYEEGVKQVGRFLVVYLLPAENPEDQAQAVVASKKIGGAVQRNRAKRLLREALFQARRKGHFERILASSRGDHSSSDRSDRLFPVPVGSHAGESQREDGSQQDGLQDILQGLWVVLVARQRILGVGSPEVLAELEDLLTKLAGNDAPPLEGAP